MLRAYRYWDFPKGLCGPDEEPREAALREVREETSLDDLTFPWGEQFYETEPYGRGKVARYYLARTERADVTLLPNPDTGRAEHQEYRWCTLEEAQQLAGPRVRNVIAWAAERLGRS